MDFCVYRANEKAWPCGAWRDRRTVAVGIVKKVYKSTIEEVGEWANVLIDASVLWREIAYV